MIVITTPTGQIGRQLLDNVLGSEKAIRVIARDPSRLSPRVRERVEIVRGSTDDLDVVNEAFAGADTVFWLVPPNPRAESIPGHILDFVRPMCDAINNQGVKRVVGVSSLGRGTAKNAGQISAIFAMDHLVESTGVSYRSLCPPGFMENMLWQIAPIKSQGLFFSPVSGERKVPICATRDIAAVAADLLLDDSWSGQDSVPIHGPEDLSHNDMAEIMSAVLRRPIRFQQVPAEAYKATLTQQGMTEAWAQGIVDMATAVDQGIYNAEPRTPQSTSPTSFRRWCEEVLKPAVLG
ncbi:NAD(P)H-binding protein [Micromonospora sp. DR5-3]|uniref:NmrA family NAD(P)-binding protein n=1 Tax=unclassified Micromonospora TaxID=2617518 RepID=UPI0011D841EC|nr:MULTISPECIES: NAD(P)H-binding protein [unclassified Micromonospora]MCW3819871.1 NAD(P)H-binding protein [Micromonospora sp. DR5-3]TYC20169.1 NAD(P)H-binding protein [Micromonospora sp. MP36]